MADRFGLSYPDLQVRFGLMSREEVWSYLESAAVAVATVTEPHRHDVRPTEAVRTAAAPGRTSAIAVHLLVLHTASKATRDGHRSTHRDHASRVSAWSLWIRRVTWSCRWEVAATLNIALQGARRASDVAVGLRDRRALAALPHRQVESRGLHRPRHVHRRRVRDRLQRARPAAGRPRHAAHVQASTSNGPPRCASRCCWPPSRSATARGSTRRTSSTVPTDFWLTVYWLLLCGTLIYLLGYGIRATARICARIRARGPSPTSTWSLRSAASSRASSASPPPSCPRCRRSRAAPWCGSSPACAVPASR